MSSDTIPSVPLSQRAEMALRSVNIEGLGLEIGPSFNPIAPKSHGYNIRILDHADQQQLREKYAALGLDQAELDRIEEVDFVWRGEPFEELVGSGTRFDYVVAAHVLEHTPDLIGFVNELAQIVSERGVISLIVPDKRYCFDFMRPLSTAGAVVEAHLEGDRRHGPASFVDTHLYTVRQHGVIDGWDRSTSDDLQLPPCRWSDVGRTVANVTATDEYVDIHRWVFTPASLDLLLSDLSNLGYLQVELDSLVPTDTLEFFVTLRHRAEAPDPEGWLSSPERWDKLQAMARDHAESTLETLDRNSGSGRVSGAFQADAGQDPHGGLLQRTRQFARRKAGALKGRLDALKT